jgi:TATA-binding protein-associated factor
MCFAGLDKGVGAMVMDAGDLINDEDLDVDMTSAATSGGGKGGRGGTAAPKQQAAELLLNMEGLSARERNRLKRKAKAMGRSESLQAPGTSGRSAKPGVSAGKGGGKSSGAAGGNNSESAGGGQQRSGSEGGGLVSSTAEAAENDEAEWAAILAGGWPFQRVCDQLSVDVLDPSWEVRHGAAVGLREVLRSHAGSACVDAPMADEGTSGWAMPGGSGEAVRVPTSTPAQGSHANAM